MRHRRSTLILLIVIALTFGSLGTALALRAEPSTGSVGQMGSNVEPYTTWVLESASQLRVAAPPDEAATAAEIDQLKALAETRDEAALLQIEYWNAGPPSYRWNQIAVDAMLKQELPVPIAYRHLALVHVAINDATVAAWDSKYTYNRPRPSEVDATLETVIDNPNSPAYPSEYAATAGAAAAMLSWLFPDDAAMYEELVLEATQSRLVAGVEYPSDVQAGLELGRQVAALVIDRGTNDGFSTQWTGTVPTEAGHWTGENPALPAAAQWQPWALESPDQFRPAPPPAYDSAQLLEEMDELRTLERTPVTNANAMFWEFGAGGRRNHWFFNEEVSRMILEANLESDPPAAARAYTMLNIAGYDSIIACWDAKYTYWAIRPFQLDPEFAPVFTTPGHPSYPSAHSCISTAAATVLGHLFPTDAERVQRIAEEAGESRIWGGIHFRSDVIAGTALGQAVGEAVIASALGSGME